MPLAIAITSIKAVGNCFEITFDVTPSGAYVTAIGGDTLDFTTATQSTRFQGPGIQIPSNLAPLQVEVWSQGGLLGYTPKAVRGTTQANCRLIFEQAAAFGVELASAAYPAALIAGVLTGRAVFLKGV